MPDDVMVTDDMIEAACTAYIEDSLDSPAWPGETKYPVVWAKHMKAALIAALSHQVPAQAGGCIVCGGAQIVCENHRDRPWDGESASPEACGCGAGAPCRFCSPFAAATKTKEGGE